MQKDDQQNARPEPMLTDESTILQPNLFTGTSTVITEPVLHPLPAGFEATRQIRLYGDVLSLRSQDV